MRRPAVEINIRAHVGTGEASGTRRLLVCVAVAAAIFAVRPMAAPAQPVLADYTTLTPISDGNGATDDRGWANVEINATAFKNQSLVTVGNYQFTSYYAADQTLILGRRNLVTNPNQWFLLRTGQTSANINDSHNISAIGIDGDGILHVAWGVHNNPLRYMRTDQSVLSDAPFTVPGNTTGQVPLQNQSITYPDFTHIPGTGDLLLAYRTGGSGNGEYQLSRWNNASNTWTAVHAVLNSGNANMGPQPWIDNDFSSTQAPPNVNAYHNGLVYDSTGRLHTTWTWRTGGDSTTGFTDYQSNHNFMYAYSDNHGVDWRLGDGTLLARNGVHDIDENNATPAIAIPDGSSLINQSSSAVGPDDHLYVATWYAPLAGSGNHVRQFMLHEYDGASWQAHQVTSRNPEGGGIGTNRVPESQLGAARMSRPIVLTDEDNRVLLVYSDVQRGQGVTVAYSQSPSRDDWEFVDILTNENVRLWEPKYDQTRWETDGVLSMLYQPSGQGLSPTTVSILEWDARTFFQNLAGPPLTLEINRSTGEVVVRNPDSSVAMTDYTIASPSGQLSPSGWQSLADQAYPGWNETQALATALAEDNVTDSLILNQNDTVGMGNAFAGSAIAFGVDAPSDVTFNYTANEEQRTGAVTYVGQSRNNLTLWVDPNTGRTRLENTSSFPVAIDAYTITSDGGRLDVDNWNSLDDQNAENGTWFESNPSAQRVSELQSGGSTELVGGENYEMGALFKTGMGDVDLEFQFVVTVTDTTMTGVVLTAELGVPGDYNDDGTVDAADYVVWRDSVNTSTKLVNDTTPGTVTAADYQVWRANFGKTFTGGGSGSGNRLNSLAAPVPEPSAALLAAAAIVAAPLARRRRR